MKGVEGFKARLGANIQESMGGGQGGAGGPLPAPTHGVPARYDGVTRPRDSLTIPVGKLQPDPDQPRKEFDPEALAMLAESLKARGQLQPIRVRWDEGRGGWTIIAGERRWRAAQIAGLEVLAAVEAKGSPSADDLLEDQLVENCVRADLKPIEQAHAFKALMDRRGYSGRQLADVLHISHMSVQRALVLLELPEGVQEQVEQGSLAPSVAAELAKLPGADAQAAVAQAAVEQKMTRAEVAEFVQARRAQRPAPAPRPDPVTLDLGDGCTLTIRWRKAGGPDLVKALRQALKLAQARDSDAA